MSTHIFKKKDSEYEIIFKDKDWGIVKHFDRIGLFHKCINATWTKNVLRITHMYLRAPENFTCSYCHKTPLEGVYALWALLTWDTAIWGIDE